MYLLFRMDKLGEAAVGIKVALIVVLIGTVLLGACSSGPGGETTCGKFVALAPTVREQLMEGKHSTEQDDIVKRMLAAHGKDNGPMNVVTAEWQIMQFCGLAASDVQHSDMPIENGITWK